MHWFTLTPRKPTRHVRVDAGYLDDDGDVLVQCPLCGTGTYIHPTRAERAAYVFAAGEHACQGGERVMLHVFRERSVQELVPAVNMLLEDQGIEYALFPKLAHTIKGPRR